MLVQVEQQIRGLVWFIHSGEKDFFSSLLVFFSPIIRF